MKRLVVFLFCLPLWGVNPVATVTQTPNAAAGTLWDINTLFHFNASGAYNFYQILYSTTQHCAGVAPATFLAAGGTIQPATHGETLFATTDMTAELAGLNPSTTYNYCISLSNDNGTTWDNTNEYTITTLSSQNQMPRPVKRFNSDLPNTTGYNVVTALADCSDLNSLIDTAMFAQVSIGTIIILPHTLACIPLQYATYSQLGFKVYAQDIISWLPANVTLPSTITLPSGKVAAMTEGDMVTLGKHYSGSLPSSNSCLYGNGLVTGTHYYIHKVNSTDIQLHCEAIDGTVNPAIMTFSDIGTSSDNFEMVPWHVATGTCPDVTGSIACTYWARNLKWIILEGEFTETNKFPPYGTRVDPSYFTIGNTPKIIDPLANINSTSSTKIMLSFQDPDGGAQTMAGNIIVRGLEFTFETDSSQQQFCVATLTSEFAGPVILAQNYFHGLGYPQRWGGASCTAWSFSGTNISIRDNYWQNMTTWSATNSGEGSGGNFPRGPGPLQWMNNYLEGVGVAAHWDSGGNHDFLRGDNFIIRNTFTAKTEWIYGYPGSLNIHFRMRQPFEFKSGWRNHVEGNIVQNCWIEVVPSSICFLVSSTGEGGQEGEGTTDLKVINNIFRHGPGVASFPSNTIGGNRQTIPPNRNYFANNLAYDITTAWTTSDSGTTPRGWAFEGANGSSGTADHNTLAGTTGAIPIISLTFNMRASKMAFTSNIFYLDNANKGFASEGTVGPFNPCSGVAQALADCWYPNNLISKNVMGSVDSSQAQMIAGWPSGLNIFPSNPADLTLNKWVDAAHGNYAVQASSPLSHAGLDGNDVGVYMPAIWNATGHVIINDKPVTSITTNSAIVNFVAPDGLGCPIDWSASAFPASGVTPTRATDSGTAIGPRNVSLIGLPSATLINFRVNCAVEQPIGTFTTQ